MRCMCRRLAGRPTGDQRDGASQVPPPAGAVRSRRFVSIGRPGSLVPWIIRTRYGPQPEEKAVCPLRVDSELRDGSTRGWRGPKSPKKGYSSLQSA